MHDATLTLLRETGVEVRRPEALELLAEAGARVSGTRARLTPELVDWALNGAPHSFVLKARPGGAGSGGEAAADGAAEAAPAGSLKIADGVSHFGTGSDCVYVRDPDTGVRRQAQRADVEAMAALCEKLSQIDFVMSMGLPADAPAELGDLVQFAAMLAGNYKLLLTTAHDGLSLERMKAMAARGEADSFGCYAMPNPPLIHSADALDKLAACARLGIPMIYAPAPAAGTTAPASLAATIVVGNAETLSGLVIHQLVVQGAPFVYGVGCGAFDMRTAVDVYGAPEHFPATPPPATWLASTGCPASRTRRSPTPRSSTSSGPRRPASRRCWGALSRATLLHDVGYLESGMQSSLETVVLGNELVGFARALLADVDVGDEALALAEIEAAGPGGNHFSRPYTRRHHRESWQPRVLRPQRVRSLAERRCEHPEGARARAHGRLACGPAGVCARRVRARAARALAGRGGRRRGMSTEHGTTPATPRPMLGMLGAGDLQRIHEAALAFLEQVGIEVRGELARAALLGAGAAAGERGSVEAAGRALSRTSGRRRAAGVHARRPGRGA